MTPYRKKRLATALSLAKQLSEIVEEEWNNATDSDIENKFFGDSHFQLEIMKEKLERMTAAKK